MVDAAVTSFSALVRIVLDLGERYYKERRQWEAFAQKVNQLRRESKIWVKELENCGILDQDVRDALRDAMTLLEKQKGILSDRLRPRCIIHACVTRCCSRMHGILFVNELDERLKELEEAFTPVSKLLEAKQKVKGLAESCMLNTPQSLIIRSDRRYVPFEETEKKLSSALENYDPSGPTVVLLHGGPGQGKSTLAKEMAVRYEKSSEFFEQVIFLECGRDVKISLKQLELLQLLAVNGTEDKKDEKDEKQSTSDRKIVQLRAALRFRKILIVFDDVWEEEFLQDMILLCGDKVKLLVTSQKGELCRHLNCNCEEIPIQEVPDEVAQKIVFRHVDFPDQHIPDQEILDFVGKIIRDTGGNPLALAIVAAAINRSRKDSVSEWREAHRTLTQLLKENKSPLYPRSCWAAIQLSVKRVSEEARALLILVYSCKGPSVPEDVIRFFFNKIITDQREGMTFRTLANELEDRLLVKITCTFVDSNQDEKSWSTHSLQKRFMTDDKSMQEEKQKLFERLLAFSCTVNITDNTRDEISPESTQGEDATVQTILCALYCEDQFAKKAVSQLNIEDDRLNDLRKKTFEPITRLLGHNTTEKWTSTRQAVAKQVFVQYFYKCKFDDETISDLLKMSDYPAAQSATLAIIEDLFMSLETPDLQQNRKLLPSLVTLLDNESPILQEKAAKCFSQIACENESLILNESGALVGLVNALCKDGNPSLQYVAARALFNLGFDQNSKLKILKTGTLQGLVNALSKDDNQKLQAAAASTLSLLADGPESCKLLIVEEDGAVEALVKLLSKDKNALLQSEATRALRNLAAGGDTIKLSILKQEGVLAALGRRCLKSFLGRDAVEVVCYLAEGQESCEREIVGAVAVLVKSLFNDKDVKVQQNAASALSGLATSGNTMRLCILKQEGVLAALVSGLSKEANPKLQISAAEAIVNLSAGSASMLAEEKRALRMLANCLSYDGTLILRHQAEGTLFRLADGGKEIRRRILDELREFGHDLTSLFDYPATCWEDSDSDNQDEHSDPEDNAVAGL